jgi:tRNA (mo5U34)-methyltransferase
MGVSLPIATDRRLVGSAAVQRVIKPVLKGGRSSNSHRALATTPADATQPLPAERPEPSKVDAETRDLMDRVARIDWHQTIDLGSGVVTPGFVDHRDQVDLHKLPASLAGKRCLDVATSDGFWAFEMEKRGAAEVVAIDVSRISEIDMPERHRQEMLRKGEYRQTGEGFRLAHQALGSRVQRKTISVYDLSPDLVGEFDFILVSDLLLHLRDPQKALDHIRSICRGTLYVADAFNAGLEPFGDTCLAEYPRWIPGDNVWWYLGRNTIKRMLKMAAFDTVDELAQLHVQVPGAPAGSLQPGKVVLRATVSAHATNEPEKAELSAVR